MNDRDFIADMQARCAAQLGQPVPTPIPPTPTPTPTPVPPSVGNYVDMAYTGKGNMIELNFGSQIVCLPLPGYGDIPNPQGGGTIIVDSVAGASGTDIEICVSRTKGLIDPAGNYSAVRDHNSPNYVNGDVAPWKGYGEAFCKVRGMMWVPASAGPWFVNVKVGPPGPARTTWNY